MEGRVMEGAGDAVVGRRERKKLATREALQRAALELVAERGLDRVTIEDISDAADVSGRTFFNYFSSKEEAVAAPDPSRSDRLRDALVERPAGEDPVSALRAVLLGEISEVIAKQAEWVLRAKVVADNPSLLSLWVARFSEAERAVAEAIAERMGQSVDDDIYPRLLAAVALSAWRSAVTRWNGLGGAEPLDGLVEQAFDLLAAGMQPIATSRSSL
jgi:AcrR family transcriptional regulator